MDWEYEFLPKNADRELQSSQKVTLPLKDRILDQDREYGYDIISDQTNVSKDDMVGHHPISLPNVNVVTVSMLSMHSPVQRVAFHLSDAMRAEISLPPCSQKYVVKSLNYSL